MSHTTHAVAQKPVAAYNHTWFVAAVGVQIAAFALAGAAWFGWHLPEAKAETVSHTAAAHATR
jgi:hypothetical protein